jgi:DNA-binding transcriptional MocR family regulator
MSDLPAPPDLPRLPGTLGRPDLIVDSADPTPPYEQLRRQLAALILGGALAAASRLPPLRQLAGDLGLAVGTVARTYRELEAAGLIVSRRGGGTRVADSPFPASGIPRTASAPDASPPRLPDPAVGIADAGAVSDTVRRAAEEYVGRARALGAGGEEIVRALWLALQASG